jgi:hypothetical protein
MSKISKSSIMSLLSSNFTAYASTQWLKNPNEAIHGLSPSECMSKNKHIKKVYNALSEEITKQKNRRCK